MRAQERPNLGTVRGKGSQGLPHSTGGTTGGRDRREAAWSAVVSCIDNADVSLRLGYGFSSSPRKEEEKDKPPRLSAPTLRA
jgi:hypothetical protein